MYTYAYAIQVYIYTCIDAYTSIFINIYNPFPRTRAQFSPGSWRWCGAMAACWSSCWTTGARTCRRRSQRWFQSPPPTGRNTGNVEDPVENLPCWRSKFSSLGMLRPSISSSVLGSFHTLEELSIMWNDELVVMAVMAPPKTMFEYVWGHFWRVKSPNIWVDPSRKGPASQEHTAVVFAEEVRGLHEQLGEIKNLLNSSWPLGATVEDSL